MKNEQFVPFAIGDTPRPVHVKTGLVEGEFEKQEFVGLGRPNRMIRLRLYTLMRVPPDILVQLGQVGTLVLGSLGVWVAMFNQRRQLNAQMFIEISRRFQDLLRMFPTEAWLANRNPSAPLPPPSQEITDCALYCIQLMADVFQLRQDRYISKRLWCAWEREIRHILEGPVFQREWKTVAVEFSHNANFQRYLDTLMQKTSDGDASVFLESSLPSAAGSAQGSTAGDLHDP
jgi:hypothetical protein